VKNARIGLAIQESRLSQVLPRPRIQASLKPRRGDKRDIHGKEREAGLGYFEKTEKKRLKKKARGEER